MALLNPLQTMKISSAFLSPRAVIFRWTAPLLRLRQVRDQAAERSAGQGPQVGRQVLQKGDGGGQHTDRHLGQGVGLRPRGNGLLVRQDDEEHRRRGGRAHTQAPVALRIGRA